MDNQAEKDKKLTGLSGWLILVAIGLIVSVVRVGQTFLETFSMLDYPFDQIADYLSVSSSELFAYILFGIIYNVLFGLFTLYLVYLFFKKDYRLPRYFICWSVINLVMITIDAGISHNMGFTEVFTGAMREVYRQCVYCVIWIPYFVQSVRVKNTFVNNKPAEKETNQIVM